ncbi:MAG TPA: hypothetical protein VN848_03880 [Gemmatimonadales bacterium]|nr:hypothetical protein [Gemmatimonadales bacterium]
MPPKSALGGRARRPWEIDLEHELLLGVVLDTIARDLRLER